MRACGKIAATAVLAAVALLLLALLAPGCGTKTDEISSTPGATAPRIGIATCLENVEEPADSGTGDYEPRETAPEPGADSAGEYRPLDASNPRALAALGSHKWNSRQLHRIDETIRKSGRKGFTFAVLSDNHCNYPVFRGLLDKIKSSSPQFVMHCGDLGQTGSRESFTTFIDNLKSFPKPLMVAIGNHDLTFHGSNKSNANFKEFFGRTYYAFTLRRCKFIVLDDSNRTGLGAHQTKWLASQLKKADNKKKYDHCFVFMHVPLKDPSHHGPGLGHGILDSANERKMQKLFDRHHVSVIFTGHVHGWFEGRWGKTGYVITGGAGGTLGGSDPKHFFYHYLQVTVEPGKHPSWKVVKLTRAATSRSVLVPLALVVPERACAASGSLRS